MGISVYPAASAAPIRKSQTFTSSGTFTLPSGYGASKPLFVEMEVCGGGGGGGSGAAAASNAGGGGGGASGVTTFFTNVPLTANATITIGAGGTGGAARTPDPLNGLDGTYGGSSNVNSTYYSPGGGYGNGGLTTATASFGAGVISNGYSISAAYSASAQGGTGGSGGSGGALSASIATNPVTTSANAYYRGGVYGFPGHYVPAEPSGGNGVIDVTPGNGYGLAFNAISTASFTTATPPLKPDLLQRGGGGGGGHATSTGSYGLGGGAGTKTSGGLTGIRAQTTGDKNGASATDPGCGGGGGGGGYNVNSGAGGNGAAGYVTIYWWE